MQQKVYWLDYDPVAAYRNRHDWTARIEHLTPSSSLRQSWRRPFGVRQIRTLSIRG